MATTSEFKSMVGWNVKKLRLDLDVSQEDLSERCGIYRTYLSRIESGNANPSLLVLVALAMSLDVGMADLLRRDAGYAELSRSRCSQMANRTNTVGN